MAVLGLDHINIRTAELTRTCDFFREVMGLTPGWRPAFDFPGAWLYLGDKPVVHLVEVTDPPGASAGRSLDHAAFLIDDYDAAVAALDRFGSRYRATTTPEGDVRQLFITDVNGAVIELNCPN